MSAVLPHYKQGPASYQVSTLTFGGQLVEPTTQTAGTTDFTVKPAAANSVNVLGVAAADANVIATQTGAPNTYGEPLIDLSVLGDYVPVWYGGIDILVWYSAQAVCGQLLLITANGTVGPYSGGTYSQIVGKCTANGGVTSAQLTQQIGGLGSAVYFLARARIF
jgi:hypothetical protein